MKLVRRYKCWFVSSPLFLVEIKDYSKRNFFKSLACALKRKAGFESCKESGTVVGNEYDTKSYEQHISMISVGVVEAGG